MSPMNTGQGKLMANSTEIATRLSSCLELGIGACESRRDRHQARRVGSCVVPFNR